MKIDPMPATERPRAGLERAGGAVALLRCSPV
jgi:hypothetical protein